MANQYKNLAEFNAYKDRISEYIAKELAKFPNYLRVIQKSVSGLAYTPPTNEEIGSDWYPIWFEDYNIVEDGLIDLLDVQAWTQRNRPDIAADIQQMIVGNKEMPPRHPSHNLRRMQKEGGWFQKTLKEGKVFQGRNADEIMVVFDDEFSSQSEDVFIIDYIAYKLAGNEPEQTLNIKLLENNIAGFEWLPFPMPYVEINNLDKVILAPDAFKRIFNSGDWLTLDPTFSEYFDFGVDADAALSSVESDLAQLGFKPFLQDDYKLWDNTSQFLPVGVRKRQVARPILEDVEDIKISELLPGDLQARIDDFFDSWNNLKQFIPVGYQSAVGYNMIFNGDFGGGIGPGIFVGSQDNDNVTQDIVVKENPAFSPYVLRNSSNGDHFYEIKLENPALLPGNKVTLSCWACKGEGFTANLNKLFTRVIEYVYNDGSRTTIVANSNDEILPSEEVDIWSDNSDSLEWRRFRKTFQIPESPFDKSLNRMIIYWQLNNLQSPNAGNQNNNNITFKFITGLRAEIGDTINTINYINLIQSNPKTHFQLVRDIQDLTLQGQVPIFSTKSLRNFVDAIKISSVLEDLYNEVKTNTEASLDAYADTTQEQLIAFSNTISSTLNFLVNFSFGGDFLPDFVEENLEESNTLLTELSVTINAFKAQVTALRNEIIKTREWTTSAGSFGTTDDILFISDQDGDGFDDVSYQAGYNAGLEALNNILGRPPVDDQFNDNYDDPSYNAGVTYGFEGGYEAGRLAGHNDILGCTDPNAINYNPNATFDNGSCVFDNGDDDPQTGNIPEENIIGFTDKDGDLVGGA
tara:strand:- start:2806 stop:5217 length:2412 start_codon:yes stop_codon:yes gene_type:complete